MRIPPSPIRHVREAIRPFGLELEFSLPNLASHERAEALKTIGEQLHGEGLTATPKQVSHHSTRGDYSHQLRGGWVFETESQGVHGEVISPVMRPGPDTWRAVEDVVDILRANGAEATPAVGGHVHVGTADYASSPVSYSRLLDLFHGHEDDLYRLGTNSERGAHRPLKFNRPNRVPAADLAPLERIHASTRGLRSDEMAVRFSKVNLGPEDHVEHRFWDGVLDLDEVKAHVDTSVALVDAARRGEQALMPHQPLGTNVEAIAAGASPEGDVAHGLRLIDELFVPSPERDNVESLFLSNPWQPRDP